MHKHRRGHPHLPVGVLLVVAFAVEPVRAFRNEMRWSQDGLFLLFLGSMSHLVCGAVSAAPAPGEMRSSTRLPPFS